MIGKLLLSDFRRRHRIPTTQSAAVEEVPDASPELGQARRTSRIRCEALSWRGNSHRQATKGAGTASLSCPVCIRLPNAALGSSDPTSTPQLFPHQTVATDLLLEGGLRDSGASGRGPTQAVAVAQGFTDGFVLDRLERSRLRR